MFSKESLANLSLSRILGAAWVIFTTLYFLLSIALPYMVTQAQNVALQGSFQNGQSNGYEAAVLFKHLKKEPVPVNFGTGAPVGILSLLWINKRFLYNAWALKISCGRSSMARVSAFQADCYGFESHRPLHFDFEDFVFYPF
jgi:hypothetical protein